MIEDEKACLTDRIFWQEFRYTRAPFGTRRRWFEVKLWPLERFFRRWRCAKHGHNRFAGPPFTWKTWCWRCGSP
jgi:hypothetical protein